MTPKRIQRIPENKIFISDRTVVLRTGKGEILKKGFKLKATILKKDFQAWREKDMEKMKARFGANIEIDYRYKLNDKT